MTDGSARRVFVLYADIFVGIHFLETFAVPGTKNYLLPAQWQGILVHLKEMKIELLLCCAMWLKMPGI